MQMKRRDLLLAALSPALSVPAMPRSASARLRCSRYDPWGSQQCEAGIDSTLATVTVGAVPPQYLSQWCWAACIEMVFRYYGYRVDQTRIVRETFGSIVNFPGNAQQILANLNRPWTDRRGRRFGVTGDVFTAQPSTAAQDLADDMPLIIGTTGHAMVLTSLTYWRTRFGAGDVTDAIVRDPWPGRGRRSLSPEEWYRTNLLVRIRVFGL